MKKNLFYEKLKKSLFCKNNDDRVKDEISRLYSKAYLPILFLSIVSIILKLFIFEKGLWSCDVELIGVIGSLIILFSLSLYYKIPLKYSQDQHICKIQQNNRLMAFYFIWSWYLIGVLYKLLSPSHSMSSLMDSLPTFIWMIVLIPLNIIAIRKGLLTRSVGKNKVKHQRTLKIATFVGSIIFGIIMAKDKLFGANPNYSSGALKALFYAIFWGLLFYFLMKRNYTQSEKNADKLLEGIDEE